MLKRIHSNIGSLILWAKALCFFADLALEPVHRQRRFIEPYLKKNMMSNLIIKNCF